MKTARHKGPLTPTKTNYLKAGIKTQYLVTEGTKKERERERGGEREGGREVLVYLKP